MTVVNNLFDQQKAELNFFSFCAASKTAEDSRG